MPPSIDSLELPPFRPRFPWWGADLQTIAILLNAKVADLAPHTSERVLFPMADRTGDILLGMLDQPAEPVDGRPLMILLHGLTGDEASPYVLAAARHLLDRGYSGVAPECARRGPLAALLQGALPCRPHGRLPACAVADSRRTHAATAWSRSAIRWAAPCCSNILARKGPFRRCGRRPRSARRSICCGTCQHMMKPRNWLYHRYMLRGIKAEAMGQGVRMSDEERAIVRVGAQRVGLRRPLHRAALRLPGRGRLLPALRADRIHARNSRADDGPGRRRRPLDPGRALSRVRAGRTIPGCCRSFRRPAVMSASMATRAGRRGAILRWRNSSSRIAIIEA